MLFALIAFAALCVALVVWGDARYGFFAGAAMLLGAAGVLISFVVLLFYISIGWDWLASGTKAELLNREYGTHYTLEEIFFASDLIDTIRDLDRKRIEVNGDLFREKPDK
jgi:hypothetical protein